MWESQTSHSSDRAALTYEEGQLKIRGKNNYSSYLDARTWLPGLLDPWTQ